MVKKFLKIKYLIRVLCYVFCVLLLSACATTPTAEDIKKAGAHYKLGISYLNKNQFKEAFVEFQKSIRLNPKDKHSLNALGHISTARFKEYDKAISYYKRSISIDKNFSEAMNNLGVTYLEMGNWDEAIKYFKMALENPLYATPDRAYSNIGYTLYRKGEYLEAVNTLTNTIKRYPESPQSFYVLGIVYIKFGNIKAAIDNLNKVITLSPGYIDAHWELADAYLRIGNNEKALEHFKIITTNDTKSKRSKKAQEYIELLEK